ncbi:MULTISPECIES: hypothetical protein [unclassified Rhizobium]|uniref:hypothetical protein n=1 Tax=unclassified Rhizobium TaxID=2613769 RepID=UPI001ADCF092|nr:MULTISPECIES: hypothetical protein [unclassified Rhizobium]MBO9125110.1 hypothetical protein [Rhizobium sp. 16-488-2b]MBO9175695.1 hypothetical protein [Rhizobium sp. 16-488-2a]
MVMTPLDNCLEAVRKRIKQTKDPDARSELVAIRNELTALKKNRILAELDKDAEKYRALIGKLGAIRKAIKETADAIEAASKAAALLAQIATLLAGV